MTERQTLFREDYRFALPVPVRWADCDAYGHVNNAIYYAMMDQVVTVYILQAGVIAMNTSPMRVMTNALKAALPLATSL